MTFLPVLIAALPGCDREADVRVPDPRPRAAATPVDSLYSTVGGATVEGQAALALTQAPDKESRTLLELDFEHSESLLKPFSLEKSTQKKLEKVSDVEAEGDANHALHIGAGIQGASSYRTPPIPVDPKAGYTLTYSVRTEGLEGPTGAKFRYGTVEPLFYAIPSFQHDPSSFLEAQDRRKRTQLTQETARGPLTIGTTAWQTHSIHFTPPATANYMVLSFDHTRAKDDKGTGRPSVGEVWFDNIRLMAEDRPLQVRYHNPDDLNATPSPLQLRVELPAEDKGAETRYALYAPAPSTLRFKRKIPAAATLSLATGVLREGWIPTKGTIDFAVWVIGADGKRSRVLERSHQPASKEKDRQWNDAQIDLGDWAGQEVTLELVTSAQSAAGALPSAAAIWGDPVLFSKEGKGRLVVLTIIDTVSVGHVGAYGYDRKTMPNLARIGKMGALFEHVYSAAPWTLPSIASIFTGLDAARHGAGERAWGEVVWRRPLPERFVTLAERLRAAGFQTTAFVNNPYLTSAFGLGQGFSTYRDYGYGTKTGAGEVGVDHAVDWLKAHRGYDRFLVMHLMDSHGPYRPPSSYANKFTSWFYSGRFENEMKGKDYLDLAEGKKPADDEKTRQQVRNLYDGALFYVDSQMGRLYESVQELAGTTDITFIVTSDHGEELFEHGGYEHGHQAYEEMLRVPLAIENPAVFKGGRHLKPEVRLTDLVPTVLAMLDLPAVEGLNGSSLLPLLKGDILGWPAPRPMFAENELYGNAQLALIRSSHKYMYNMANTNKPERRPKSASRHELYHLGRDPAEKQNISKQEPSTLNELHPLMEAHNRQSLAGRYVVAFDGGGQPHTFAGRMTIAGKGTWFAYYEDLIAPLADGSEGELQVTIRGGTLTFQVRSPRAVLAFKTQNTVDPGGIDVTFAVDGKPWTEGVNIGQAGLTGMGEGILRFGDTQLGLAPEALPDPVKEKVSIFLGKTTERALSAEQQQALPAETAEKLEALGYTGARDAK